jgi:hypothetical protein
MGSGAVSRLSAKLYHSPGIACMATGPATCNTGCLFLGAEPVFGKIASPQLLMGFGFGVFSAQNGFGMRAYLLLVLVASCLAISCTREVNTDFSGQDIQPRIYLILPTFDDCCNACANNTKCKVFTFMKNSYPHPTGKENCWLKTSASGKKHDEGKDSGSIPAVPTPPTPPIPQPTPAPVHINRACDSDHSSYAFCNTTLPLAARVSDLVGRISSNEKPNLMTARHSSPLPNLGIPAYDWGVNSIHGTQVSCGTNCAVNYPLPTAIGASFNMSLVRQLGHMMAVEQRALRLEGACEKHRRRLGGSNGQDVAADENSRDKTVGADGKDACIGLDTWAPNINLNRDPRWGRYPTHILHTLHIRRILHTLHILHTLVAS